MTERELLVLASAIIYAGRSISVYPDPQACVDDALCLLLAAEKRTARTTNQTPVAPPPANSPSPSSEF